MNTIQTQHAELRQQQRGIPPLVRDWLIDYGEEQFDGRGGVVRYFNRNSIRRIETQVGKKPAARLSEFLRCYLVQSSSDGVVITLGKRYSSRHIYRH